MCSTPPVSSPQKRRLPYSKLVSVFNILRYSTSLHGRTPRRVCPSYRNEFFCAGLGGLATLNPIHGYLVVVQYASFKRMDHGMATAPTSDGKEATRTSGRWVPVQDCRYHQVSSISSSGGVHADHWSSARNIQRPTRQLHRVEQASVFLDAWCLNSRLLH